MTWLRRQWAARSPAQRKAIIAFALFAAGLIVGFLL